MMIPSDAIVEITYMKRGSASSGPTMELRGNIGGHSFSGVLTREDFDSAWVVVAMAANRSFSRLTGELLDPGDPVRFPWAKLPAKSREAIRARMGL